MTVAYFDVFAGASGDMILGALLDLGLPIGDLRTALATLPIDGWAIDANPAMRGPIGGTQAIVSVTDSHPSRNRDDILRIIDGSRLPVIVREQSSSVFRLLADAEARVHRVPADSVRFHEVGAVDSIIDIVGAVAGLHLLDVDRVFVSSIPLGGGTVESQHGIIPVPAPAVVEIAALARVPVRPSTGMASGKEMTTPTALAIFAAIGTFEQTAMRITATGYGIGGRSLPDLPNALRVWTGDPIDEPAALVLLETNIDDMNPEILGHVLERLFALGVRDAWFTAIQMKKNRPATMLSAIVDAARESLIADLLLRETTTLGVRVQPIRRHEAEREIVEIGTPLGLTIVKIKRVGGKVIGASPEYEACRALAEASSRPLIDVYRIVEDAARALLA